MSSTLASPRQPQRSLLLTSVPSTAASRRLSSQADVSARRLSRPSSSSGLGYVSSVQSSAFASAGAAGAAKAIRRRSSGSSVAVVRDAPSWVARTSAPIAAAPQSKARPQSLLASRRTSGTWALDARSADWRAPSAIAAAAGANPRRASASAISGWAPTQPLVARRESHTTTEGHSSGRASSISSASTSAPGTPTDERTASPVLGRPAQKPQRAPLAPFTARTWARELEDAASPASFALAASARGVLTPSLSPTDAVRQCASPVDMRTPRRYVSSEGLRAASLRPLSSHEPRTPMTLEGARAIARRASAGSIGGLACTTAWREFAAASGAASKRHSVESIASIREKAPPGSASALFPDVPFRITPACVVRRRSQQRSVGACGESQGERRRSGAMSPLGSRPGSVLSHVATPGSMSVVEARRKARQVAKRHSDGVEYAEWPRVASPQPLVVAPPPRSMARPQTATQPGQLLGALANAPSPPPRAMSPVSATPAGSGRRASKRRQRTATPPGAGAAATTNFARPFRPLSVQQPIPVRAAEASEAASPTSAPPAAPAPSTPPKSRARQLAPAAQPPRPISKDGRDASPFSLSLAQALDESAAHPYADTSSFCAPAASDEAPHSASGAAGEGTGLARAPSPLASRPSRVRRLSRAIRRALSFSRPAPPLALPASLEPLPKRAKPTAAAPLTPLRRASTRDAHTPQQQRRASGSAVLAQAWRQDLARGPAHAPPSAWSPTRAGVDYTPSSSAGAGGMSGFSSSSSLSGYSTAPPQTPADSPLAPSVRGVGAGAKGKRNSAGATMAFVRLRAKSLGATKRPRGTSMAGHGDVPLPSATPAAGKRNSITSGMWPSWNANAQGQAQGLGEVGAGCLPTSAGAGGGGSEAVEELSPASASVPKSRSVKYARSNSTLRTTAGAGVGTGAGITYNAGIGAAAGPSTPPKKRASLQSLSSYLRR